MYRSVLTTLLSHPDPAPSSPVIVFMASSANLTGTPHTALLLILASLLRTLAATPLLFLDKLWDWGYSLCLPLLSQLPCM